MTKYEKIGLNYNSSRNADERISACRKALLNLEPGSTIAGSVAHAESYNTCTGFITSVPTVITTQGTWCLKQDLSTAISSGIAIAVNTNNVTIDCNDFKLGGLAAGTATSARGISAQDRLNVTVRHCNIRGFEFGVYLGGLTGGHAVEDSRSDQNTFDGILVEGEGSVVRRNRVFDTGGGDLNVDAIGIKADSGTDVIDNTVSGVVATTGGGGTAYGIETSLDIANSIVGNRVRGVLGDAPGASYGIFNISSDRVVIANNELIGDASVGSIGLRCSNSNGRATNNAINGFATAITTCANAGGNDINP